MEKGLESRCEQWEESSSHTENRGLWVLPVSKEAGAGMALRTVTNPIRWPAPPIVAAVCHGVWAPLGQGQP